MIVNLLPTTPTDSGALCYSADSRGYNRKPEGQEEIGAIRKRLAGAAAHTQSTPQELAELIASGHTIQGAQLRDKTDPDENTDSRFLRQQLFFVDIDNDEKHADGKKYRTAHPISSHDDILRISRAAGLEPTIIAESFSSGKTDPNGDPIPKYHVIFAAAEPIQTAPEARHVLLNLLGVFGGADEMLKDPARILFGSPADKPLYVQNVTNSPAALLSCYTAPEPEPAQPAELPAPAPTSRSSNTAPRRTEEADPDYLLSMIDVNALEYPEWLRVSAAYKVAGGSLEIWEQWSGQYTGGKKSTQEQARENRATWKGLTGKGITKGSLKRFAKQHSPAEYDSYLQALTPSKSTRSKSKRKTQSAAPETETQTETAAEQFGGSQTVEEPAEEQEENRNPYDKDGSGRLTCANLENALELMGITVRHNIISHKIEYTGRGLYGHDPAGLSANLPYIIYNKLQKRLQGCTVDKIAGFLNVIAFSKANEYNPVLEAISATKWDGRDHLEELYNLMQLEPADNLSRLLLKKWLMQAYCGLHNTLEESFSLDLILVLVGRQGFGKTRLLEKLALNSKNFGEGLTLDPRDKDSKLQVTSFWLAELGEIGSTMKKDIDTLKAFISLTYDENRPPYSRGTVTHPRRTSYCGTTNDMQFLIDTTGNRRFAVVKLPDDKYIDVRGQAFKQFNALQLWAQIADIVSAELAAGETYASAFRLTREELAQLETRNHLHSKPLKGEEEVRDELYFLQIELEQGRARRKAMTASQFIAEHGSLHKYTAAQIGKVLTKMGFKSMRKKVNGVSFTAYELPSILLTREEGANLAEGLE